MRGYRNLWICMTFFAWSLGETAIILWRLSSEHVGPSLGGIAAILTAGGGAAVGIVFGRGFNKKFENGAPQ